MVHQFISDDVNACRQWLTMFGFDIDDVFTKSEKWRRPNGEIGAVCQSSLNGQAAWKAIYSTLD